MRVTDLLVAKDKELERRLDNLPSTFWATVTQVNPLRVRLDADSASLPITPIDMVGGLLVNDRVQVTIGSNQIVVSAKPGGTAPPVGMVTPFAGSVAPTGWLMADGAVYSPTTYPLLYAVIGTTYGGTSIAPLLPNLAGRVPVGYYSPHVYTNALGKQGGEFDHQLNVYEMPSHTHIQDEHNHSQNSHNHPSNLSRARAGTAYSLDVPTGSANSFETDVPTGYATATNNPTTATNQYTGGNGYHNNMQPYTVLNYMVRAA